MATKPKTEENPLMGVATAIGGALGAVAKKVGLNSTPDEATPAVKKRLPRVMKKKLKKAAAAVESKAAKAAKAVKTDVKTVVKKAKATTRKVAKKASA